VAAAAAVVVAAAAFDTAAAAHLHMLKEQPLQFRQLQVEVANLTAALQVQ
jgi:hypothetical protein